jgi:hypothetical protein
VDYELTKRVLAELERHHVDYVVVGAVAVNLQGLARATEDLDVFIAPKQENVERLKSALRAVFDDPNIDQISAEDLLGEFPAIQYIPPQGGFHIDILTKLGEAFRFEDLESEKVDLGGVSVTVATPATLYRMKKGTIRPKDWGDAEALRRRFRLPEE